MADMKQTNLLQEPLHDTYEPYEPKANKPEAVDYTPVSYDAMIAGELLLPQELL
jgi:hypothetical protein